MLLQIFTLLNKLETLYGRPMYFHDEHHAKSDVTLFFTPELIESDQIIPENYDLIHIASFNTETGEIITLKPAKFITNCIQLINKEK